MSYNRTVWFYNADVMAKSVGANQFAPLGGRNLSSIYTACSDLFIPILLLVIYVYTRSVTKRKKSLIRNDFVIVAKLIVVVTIQIHWLRPEKNV